MSRLKIIAPIVTTCAIVSGLSSLTSCSSSIKLDTTLFDETSWASVGTKDYMNFSKNQVCKFEVNLSKLKSWQPCDDYFYGSLQLNEKSTGVVGFQMTRIRVQIGNKDLEPTFDNGSLWEKAASYWAEYDKDAGLFRQIYVHLNKTFDSKEKIIFSFIILSDMENVKPNFTTVEV